MKIDRIGWRDLQAFVAVAEELHFGRAAERLHVSQPPLSQRIRRMEDVLGVPLFHRTTRRVWLTDAGAALLDDARDLLARTQRALRRVQRVAAGETGRLALAAVTPAMDTFLPGCIRAFRGSRPDVHVTVEELATSDQLDALRADRLHLGLVRLAGHATHGLTFRVVRRLGYLLAVPEGHRLGSLQRVPLASLEHEDLVGLDPRVQPEIQARIDAALTDSGVTPFRLQTATTLHGVGALVAAGLGVAIVPESVASLRRAGVSYVPLHARLPDVKVSAVWRETDSSAVLAAFLELLPAAA